MENIWGILTSALVFGLFSSLHCVGMCTPLTAQFNRHVSQHISYQIGRLLSYQILGALLFFSSGQLLKLFSIQIQQYALYILIAIYVLLAIAVLLKKQSNYLFGSYFQKIFQKLFTKVAPIKNKLLHSGGIGLLSGLLPCGLLHTFLLGVIPIHEYWIAFLYISAFWIGTSPLLALGNYSFFKFRKKLQMISPRLISSTYVLMAVYLVYIKYSILSNPAFCH